MGGDAPKHILDWDDIKRGFQWEILFVFGGGAMLAHGTVHSGLAAWMAEKPRLFSGFDFQRVHVADARQEDTFLLFVFVPFCHQAADLLACLLACLPSPPRRVMALASECHGALQLVSTAVLQTAVANSALLT